MFVPLAVRVLSHDSRLTYEKSPVSDAGTSEPRSHAAGWGTSELGANRWAHSLHVQRTVWLAAVCLGRTGFGQGFRLQRDGQCPRSEGRLSAGICLAEARLSRSDIECTCNSFYF